MPSQSHEFHCIPLNNQFRIKTCKLDKRMQAQGKLQSDRFTISFWIPHDNLQLSTFAREINNNWEEHTYTAMGILRSYLPDSRISCLIISQTYKIMQNH